MITSLYSQAQEIKELDLLIENFEELWNEKFEMSLSHTDLFDSHEHRRFNAAVQEDRQELENLLFCRRLLWTRWKFVRDGIQSEREGKEAIVDDRLAWNAYKNQVHIDEEKAEKNGSQPYDIQGEFQCAGGEQYGIDHDDSDHLMLPDTGINIDEDEEVVEELAGQSVCMVHGACDHLTSQCAEAIAMLERDQYYFSRCDPRVNQNMKKNEKCKIPKYVPDKEEIRFKIKRRDLITYEENRMIYNFL